MAEKSSEKIAKFLFEFGTLKRVQRSGWALAGLKQTESVAEHSSRAAAIAFLLAEMTGANPEKAAAMAVFHDLGEARITDLHRIAERYISDKDEIERKAVDDSTSALPKEFGRKIALLIGEMEECRTKEAIAAKDADALECALQAKEYLDIGVKAAQSWIDAIKKRLKTKEARLILEAAEKMNSADWWKGLKKLD